MRRPIQVLVYPASTVEGRVRYLLLRRVPQLGLEGFWQGVTGAPEEGEDLAQAALRELREETGLVPSSLHQINYSYRLAINDSWGSIYPPGTTEIVEHVFLALLDGLLEPTLSHEHDRWGWHDFEQALRLLQWSENVEALRRSHAFVLARLADSAA